MDHFIIFRDQVAKFEKKLVGNLQNLKKFMDQFAKY